MTHHIGGAKGQPACGSVRTNFGAAFGSGIRNWRVSAHGESYPLQLLLSRNFSASPVPRVFRPLTFPVAALQL